MNVQPYAALSGLIPPNPQNPPVLADITNASIHRHRLAKRKLEESTCVTDDEYANAVVREHRRVQNVAGEQVAPPWFTAAIENALAPIKTLLGAIETRQQNASSCQDEDAITPPKHGPHPPPNCAPLTIRALQDMPAASLTDMENYYGLPHTGNLATRRRRLAKKYGVLFISTSTISLQPV